MGIDVEIVFYQILIVLVPIFVYHLFFNESNSERRKPYSKLSFILLLILVLSMSFPITFSDGYIYDFRIIPFIISFVYGGTIPGVVTGIVLLSYRFIIGGDGFSVVLINYSVTCIALVFMGKKIDTYRKSSKLVFTSVVFWANTIVVMLTLFSRKEIDQISFMVVFYSITWLCLMLVVFVIENVDQQMEIRQKLQRDEKLNVVSQLAASVAHEVRNPMTTVRGFLQLISDEENLPDSQRAYIEIALSELDHAQSIINDYLSLAKPNTEDLAAINISEEVAKNVALMTSYSNIQNVEIQTNIQNSLYIKGNKGEIKQVLVNIIKNGIEAMDNGGKLTVNAYEKNGVVSIEIIDTGKGMTKNQMKKLGTPFYTTKEKGTGVGLTISFQLVKAMKGEISVESQVGKGTVFTLQFPVGFPNS